MPYDLPLQVIWEDQTSSAYRVIGFAHLLCKKNGTHLLISAFAFFFFGCALHKECRKQEFVNIMCIKVSVKSKIAQTCSYRHRDSWLCFLKNIGQILTLLAVGIAPITR